MKTKKIIDDVTNRVKVLLTEDLDDCNYKIRQNKYEFEKLTREQTILKRTRTRLCKLIRDINNAEKI